tara:strand:- start:1170 stop:1889 length:720 start_codon:yes stop_codon:yes gene_type:complete
LQHLPVKLTFVLQRYGVHKDLIEKEKQMKNTGVLEKMRSTRSGLIGFCLVLVVGVMSGTAPANAAKKEKRVVPCAHPMFRTLDFWVGDWKVFHRETGELAAFDRVGRTLKGCAIQQSFISLDDHFSSPMVPFRMNGKSLTAFNGQQWVQFWVDNQAGSQVIKGGPEGDKFVLRSEVPVMGHDYKLTWQQQKDGTVRHTARRKKVEAETWDVLFDFIYRRNVGNVPLPDEPIEDDDDVSQ